MSNPNNVEPKPEPFVSVTSEKRINPPMGQLFLQIALFWHEINPNFWAPSGKLL